MICNSLRFTGDYLSPIFGFFLNGDFTAGKKSRRPPPKGVGLFNAEYSVREAGWSMTMPYAF